MNSVDTVSIFNIVDDLSYCGDRPPEASWPEAKSKARRRRTSEGLIRLCNSFVNYLFSISNEWSIDPFDGSERRTVDSAAFLVFDEGSFLHSSLEIVMHAPFSLSWSGYARASYRRQFRDGVRYCNDRGR